MSWMRFAPKQWTKAHMRLILRLGREGISYFSEHIVDCGGDGQFKVDTLVLPFLVVENDGDSHKRESRRRKDEWKDSVLEKHGYTVLRFTDWRVWHDLDGVVDEIKEART